MDDALLFGGKAADTHRTRYNSLDATAPRLLRGVASLAILACVLVFGITVSKGQEKAWPLANISQCEFCVSRRPVPYLTIVALFETKTPLGTQPSTCSVLA
jgi:hypothetical protein